MPPKPSIIWTIVVSCLLISLAGLAVMVYVMFTESGKEGSTPLGLELAGLLMLTVPIVFLLTVGQPLIAGTNMNLASRKWRIIIWSAVALLFVGILVVCFWVTGMERR